MITLLRCAVPALVAILAVGIAGDAHAQIVYVRPGAAVILRAPFVPTASIALPGFVPGVPPVRPYLLPRRRALYAPPYGPAFAPPALPPAYGPPPAAPRYIPGATSANIEAGYPRSGGDREFPTPAELAAFDDGTLLNAVLDAAGQLDADVGRFNTGAGWQQFLRLPADALPPPTSTGRVVLGFRSLATTLERLNAVAADPQYAMISGLPSFLAVQQALGEVVSRFGDEAPADAAGAVDGSPTVPPVNAEELPPPEPALAAPANTGAGERSVLNR